VSTADLQIDLQTFNTSGTVDGASATLVVAGTADAAALLALETVFGRLHDAVLAAGHKEVVLDFTRLTFMNSSCFSKLIAWVNRVRLLPPETSYKIRIRSNQKQVWQRRSLQAIQCFAVDLITIET